MIHQLIEQLFVKHGQYTRNIMQINHLFAFLNFSFTICVYTYLQENLKDYYHFLLFSNRIGHKIGMYKYTLN
jgi:hypothetical protein